MESEDPFPGVRFLDRTKRISEFKGHKDVSLQSRADRPLSPQELLAKARGQK
jgi:hypothetical protein